MEQIYSSLKFDIKLVIFRMKDKIYSTKNREGGNYPIDAVYLFADENIIASDMIAAIEC